MGQDLGKITVPVYFNEPISMLQKTAECMEYSKLLDKANYEQNSLIWLAYVTAFTLSQFSSIEGRKQKPFNPVLGETYELLTPDFRFMSEQVSHHPPISALCGHNNNFEVYAHTEVTGSFKKMSLRYKSLGSTYIYLKRPQDKYSIERP